MNPQRNINFIKLKLAQAEMTLQQREAMVKVWSEGTDESWQKVGCQSSKYARMKISAKHGRIAEKNRHEVEMFKSVLSQLEP